MRRLVLIFCGLTTLLSAQDTGAITGTLTDDGGTPLANANVTAYLQARGSGGSFPTAINARSGNDGTFVLNGLAAGTHLICAEGLGDGLLDPCVWSASPTMIAVAQGSSVTGVSLVAEKGVALDIRLNDTQGLLMSNTQLDDILIGVKPPANRPFLTGRLASKDGKGRTVRVPVRQGKPVDIIVSSGNFSLSDDHANAYSALSTKVTVTAPTLGKDGTPVLTVRIQGQTPKK